MKTAIKTRRTFGATDHLLSATVRILMMLVGSLATHVMADDSGSQKILKWIDQVRFPAGDFSVIARIESQTNGTKDLPRVYKVLSRGVDQSLVITREPKVEQGQAMLMIERNLWAYFPKLSQPVRLSLSQKLTGLVANGDIARASFARDYEIVKQALRQKLTCYELKAVAADVTYPKAEVCLNSKRLLQTARFFSLSGKLIKRAQYYDYQKILGRLRPLKMKMIDAMSDDQVSVVSYLKIKKEKLDSKLFNKSFIKKINLNDI